MWTYVPFCTKPVYYTPGCTSPHGMWQNTFIYLDVYAQIPPSPWRSKVPQDVILPSCISSSQQPGGGGGKGDWPLVTTRQGFALGCALGPRLRYQPPHHTRFSLLPLKRIREARDNFISALLELLIVELQPMEEWEEERTTKW